MTPHQRARLLLDAAAVDAAHEYAALLAAGDKILDATDGDVVSWYRHKLPAALARRGLALEPIRGGWRVVPAPIAPPVTRVVARAQCRCGQPVFDCACAPVEMVIPW